MPREEAAEARGRGREGPGSGCAEPLPYASPPFPWKLWVRAIPAATVLGLFSTAVFYFARSAAGEPLPLRRSVLSFGEWYAWGLLLPGIVWLARRCPVSRDRWLGPVAVHLLAGVAMALVEMGLVTGITAWYNQQVLGTDFWSLPQAYLRTASFWFPYALIIYGGIVAVVQVVDTQRRLRDEQLEAAELRAATSELRAQLADAQLRALRMQLHPHFLFNTLNTASVFMREGRRKESVELVTLLGDLLRQTLDRLGRDRIPLREELSFIEDYLEIETMRHGGRISVAVEAAPDALDALVPTMILQPLVENAVKHGVTERSEGGEVRIRVSRRDGCLELEVRDDGPGFDAPTSSVVGGGVGLRNTEERLRRQFGDASVFETGNRPGGGAFVRVEMPVANDSTRSLARRSETATLHPGAPHRRQGGEDV